MSGLGALLLAAGAYRCVGKGTPGASAFAQPLSPAQHVQLVTNPGFENPGHGVPAGWTWDLARSGHKGTVTTDTSRFVSGRASLKLAPNDKNVAQDPLSVIQIIPGGAYAGRKVEFSGYVASQGNTQGILGIMSLVKGVPQGKPDMLFQAGGAKPEWQRRSGVYTVPNDPSVQLVLICMSNGHSGASWFDDVSVVPVGSESVASAGGASTPTPAAATPPVTSGPPLTATVSVNANAVLRTIPSTLYGANVEWRWNGLGLWLPGKGPDPVVASLTRNLGVTLIRYPGGYLSDFYNWRDGIGPPAQRPVVKHQPGRNEESQPLFGTNEALEFAHDVGAHLLLTVNAGTGTASEAAGWVKYVNGQRRRVQFWEVGNELYLNEPTPVSQAVTVPPATYASRFAQFASAMRAADPGITIAAIGGVNYGPYDFMGYPHWLRTVLQRDGNQIDLVSVHDAYAPLLSPQDENADFRTVYTAMLAAPKLIAGNLAQVTDTIDRYAPPDKRGKIDIAVTEWGPAFNFNNHSRWVDHVKTLGSALFAASVLKTFIEAPRVEVANFQLLNDFAAFGVIGSNNTSFPLNPHWIPTPRYYAIQLFTRHFGTRLIRSTTDGPTFDSQAIGAVAAVKNAPYLDLVSSLSADGSHLYIIGINKHFDRDIDATISLQDFKPAATAMAWTLDGASMDANTGTGIVKAPGLGVPRQAVDPADPQFYNGNQITFDSTAVSISGNRFVYRFPAHSATSLVLVRR